MARPAKATVRTLSTGDERREDVLRAAMKVVGPRGLYGTPTMEVAAAAGISQAYLFRLFPTKIELFVAVLGRSFQRIQDAMAEAAANARADGRPVRDAMAEAYTNLLRHGFRMLFEMVEREWPASPAEVQAFFAHGMLCNVIAAMQIGDLHERWADVLTTADPEE